jgi:hypothetical protein
VENALKDVETVGVGTSKEIVAPRYESTQRSEYQGNNEYVHGD